MIHSLLLFSRFVLFGAAAATLNVALAQATAPASVSQHGDLLTISPFTLRTHCGEAEDNYQRMLEGKVPGYEHVRPEAGRNRAHTCDGGVMKLFGEPLRKAEPVTLTFFHEREPKATDSSDPSYHRVTFSSAGIATKIELQRSWPLEEDGPRRNEIHDILIKRYGPPNVIYYLQSEKVGLFQLFWGTSLKEGPPVGRVKPLVVVSGVKKKYDACVAQHFERSQSLEISRTIGKAKFLEKALPTCSVFSLNREEWKPIEALLNRETDVLTTAMVEIHEGNERVSRLILDATDVVPHAAIVRERREEARLSIEQDRARERERREKAMPRF